MVAKIKELVGQLVAHFGAKWVWYIGAVLVVSLLSLFGIKVPSPNFPNGWVEPEPSAIQEIKKGLEFPEFAQTPAYKACKDDFGVDPKEVYLWKAWLAVDGKLPPPRNQGNIGSCVGNGTASGIETSWAVEIASNNKLKANPPPHWFSAEVVYGISRVDIGGKRIRGDGSVGAWAVKGSKDVGMAQRKKYDSVDLTNYSVSTCRKFGDNGIPEDVRKECKEHPIKDYSQVKTVAECYASLENGYAVVVCSGQGFSSRRDKDGFCAPSGSWAHCMVIIGSRRNVDRPGFFIWNSWGEDWVSGPKGAGDPPEGGFWADEKVVARMLSQDDSWSVSPVLGFAPRKVDKLDWFVEHHPIQKERWIARDKAKAKQFPLALGF